MNSNVNNVTLEKIVSLCKRRGLVFQTAEIYGGLNGVYDFGPLGTKIKKNLRKLWLESLVDPNFDILELEGALLSPADVWKASGHLENFHDPMVDCTVCKRRYRADDIDLEKNCPNCGNKSWTDVRDFNLMFKTQLGAVVSGSTDAYLRPETAQSIFINFKNIISTYRVKIPFGIAQIGKAFRNEITPKQFLFRMREFEQMEIEFFCKGETAMEYFDFWSKKRMQFYKKIGLNIDHLRLRKHDEQELSHYSTATSDVEYNFPFGWKELEGIAYRTDFDLSQHMKCSGKDLAVYDTESKTSYIPHVVECSVGTDRLFLTLLFDSFYEQEVDGDVRTVLKFSPLVAPYKAAIMPLTNKQEEAAHKLFLEVNKNFDSIFDASGSIGKRYRRQDEIGTPFCFTYDFESDIDKMVTVRFRDSMQQERIKFDKIIPFLQEHMKNC